MAAAVATGRMAAAATFHCLLGCIIGELAGLEIGRYVIYGLGMWALPGADIQRPEFSPTAWFSVLVVFVLAEVFREGARLRREAELTI